MNLIGRRHSLIDIPGRGISAWFTDNSSDPFLAALSLKHRIMLFTSCIITGAFCMVLVRAPR